MRETLHIDIQADLAARCRADPWLGTLNIITDDIQDVTAEISKAIGLIPGDGRIGACVIVLQPRYRDQNPNIRFHPQEVEVTFHIYEMPVLNRLDPAGFGTNHSAWQIMSRIVYSMKTYQPVCFSTPFVQAGDAQSITKPDDGMVALEIKFRARTNAPSELRKVEIPLMTMSASGVSFSCATDAVDIYYTWDGSHPYAGNSAATLYTGTPVLFPASAWVRACAFRQQSGTDWIPSDVNCQYWDVALSDNLGNPLGAQNPAGQNLAV